MTTIRLMGADYHVTAIDIDADYLEGASPSDIERSICVAQVEYEVARSKGLHDLANEIRGKIAELRAEQRIKSNAASREHGIMCG